jgi:adenine phosphoribosyltransferase
MQDPITHLKSLIRPIQDFPKPGILFVVGAESRGFIFGTAVACAISAGFQLVRKPGKLPHKRVAMKYELEYGFDTLEMHEDAIAKGQRVLIVDDVLATGGTMKACCDLVTQLGGEIAGVAVVIELEALGGRKRVPNPERVHSVLRY